MLGHALRLLAAVALSASAVVLPLVDVIPAPLGVAQRDASIHFALGLGGLTLAALWLRRVRSLWKWGLLLLVTPTVLTLVRAVATRPLSALPFPERVGLTFLLALTLLQYGPVAGRAFVRPSRYATVALLLIAALYFACVAVLVERFTISKFPGTATQRDVAVAAYGMVSLLLFALAARRVPRLVRWGLLIPVVGLLLKLAPILYRPAGRGVPIGAVGVALVATSLLFLLAFFLPQPPPPPGCCAHCGYDLTGNTSGRCPECGRACTPTAAHVNTEANESTRTK